ncbi:hypothetical protein PD5205_02079 [Xanthomonas fragariae]|uniref:Uncharacterized protein n=1 Tax=Xanthomonas fragariae TaxID=48664 RepID=A0A1Y6HAP7_9XANT|nr:hypothetical protein BER93_10005 [Xanthomonas fragariae]ENZ94035.1 hypothetical protein O1K_17578 [Xanthomonas fragariae LMG 25863]SMQ95256.1 hypothetical protein NBC2815_01916 [Xanthomonas fragariae]SMQ99350.1 hypothetical protein PD885_02107 [Xanthomonas fragariae]SMR03381.1 hypothetical protein PD5205_02079 [Xanthomonas fragariae]
MVSAAAGATNAWYSARILCFEQLHATKINRHARTVEVAFLRFFVRSKRHAVSCRVEDHTLHRYQKQTELIDG